MKYSIDELCDVFIKQQREFEINTHELKEKHPDVKTNEFNLPRALGVICYEIKKLKERKNAIN